jgi:hypothetical protein
VIHTLSHPTGTEVTKLITPDTGPVIDAGIQRICAAAAPQNATPNMISTINCLDLNMRRSCR